MRKIDKIILLVVFGSIPLGLILFLIYSAAFGPTLKQTILKRDSLETVSGVVDTLFNDERNHNIRTAIFKNGKIFQIAPEWELKIEIGDSLYKKRGSFFLEVYKRLGQKINLDYRKTIRPDL